MENIQTQSAIKKVMQNEFTQIIAIIVGVYSFVSLVIFPIRSIQQDIDNIKTNHLHTIEMNMNELKALQSQEAKENSSDHKKITEELTKTATILDQHLKIK